MFEEDFHLCGTGDSRIVNSTVMKSTVFVRTILYLCVSNSSKLYYCVYCTVVTYTVTVISVLQSTLLSSVVKFSREHQQEEQCQLTRRGGVEVKMCRKSIVKLISGELQKYKMTLQSLLITQSCTFNHCKRVLEYIWTNIFICPKFFLNFSMPNIF